MCCFLLSLLVVGSAILFLEICLEDRAATLTQRKVLTPAIDLGDNVNYEFGASMHLA